VLLVSFYLILYTYTARPPFTPFLLLFACEVFHVLLSAGRRAARTSNVVLRRFMTDLLHSVCCRYTTFITEEYRGSYSDFQQERQLFILQRKIIRWFIDHP